MYKMNREALQIPKGKLIEALQQRIARKKEVLAERERTRGADRVWIGSYMENLALPELFGFDMNDLFRDPHFAVETELRHRIFWADNTHDDWLPNFNVNATVGMYWDMTLFGAEVRHSPQGVPEFLPHPIAQTPDLSLIAPFEFKRSGVMPGLLRQYREMVRISREEYGDALQIGFPNFGRGPLDICIQMRGYENFVADTVERPEFVHRFIAHVIGERRRFRRLRREFLGEAPAEDPTTGIDDDWVNIPFISPEMFRTFALPAYREIQREEGALVHFHTCGILTPIIGDLMANFPRLRWLDVSGWNDFEALDRMVDPGVGFGLSFVNSFVLSGTPQAHREKLERIAAVSRRRRVGVTASAIVRLHDDFEEDLRRTNAFIDLAREILAPPK